MDIDYLILAEHAEVTGSKLYLMGGGWDTMNVPDVPANVRLTAVAGIRVEWDETNVSLPVVVRVDDDDAQEVFRLDGQMNVGRPPQLLAGTSHASEANAPWVLVCESPQTTVIPGRVAPCSGPITWTMP